MTAPPASHPRFTASPGDCHIGDRVHSRFAWGCRSGRRPASPLWEVTPVGFCQTVTASRPGTTATCGVAKVVIHSSLSSWRLPSLTTTSIPVVGSDPPRVRQPLMKARPGTQRSPGTHIGVATAVVNMAVSVQRRRISNIVRSGHMIRRVLGRGRRPGTWYYQNLSGPHHPDSSVDPTGNDDETE